MINNKETIIKELNQAQYSLNIALSWLTDIDLINVLKTKAKEGIIIKIVLSGSEWNHLRYYDFKELINLGSIINKSGNKNKGDNSFMNFTFFIIDDTSVIHGLHNWTKNSSTNSENFAVDKNIEVIRKFNKEFHYLLKESDKYLNGLNDKLINELIPILNEKELNGFNPEIDTLYLNKEQNIPKYDELHPNLESLIKNWNDKQSLALIKDINCKLYSIEIMNEVRSPTYFSIIIGDSANKIKCKIPGHLLLRSIIKNKNFAVVYSILAGIPEILLTMLLSQPEGLSIYGPMKFKLFENTNYFELADNGNNIAFYLSSYEPYERISNKDFIYKQGYNITLSIIKGEIDEKEFQNRFKIIKWWLK